MSKLARIKGRYRLQTRVGKGDLGVLWAAVDERSGLPVAVRVLQRGLDDHRRVARFRQSALASARLDHPGIVRVLDEGMDDLGPFIVSAWVDAAPLSAWLRVPPASDVDATQRTELPWGFLKAVMLKLCDALAYVHACGLVHLDLRPHNVLVRRTATGPEVLLVDVGCGRIDDGWSDTRPGAPATLKYLGTLRYLAPEVAESPPWKTGPWSDLYSIGLILWELLTGSIPFEHLNGVSLLLERAVSGAPTLPPGVGGAMHGPLDALLSRLLARDPLERPQAAAQVRQTLAAMPGDAVWIEPAPQPQVQLPPSDPRRERAAGFPLRALHPGPPVGRDGPVDQLGRALHAVVVGGRSRLVVVEGPPSTGKGRVVEAVARSAAMRGAARMWQVRFSPGQPPGTGLVGAIEDLMKAGGTDRAGLSARVDALPLLLGVDAADFVGVLPALVHPDAPGFMRPGGFAEPGADIGGVDVACQAGALFLELVRRSASNDAILLWFEDIQYAPDSELVDLVTRILADPQLPVCVVATGRSGTDGLRRLLAAHPAGPHVEHIVLGPLDATETRAWLRDRLSLSPMVEQQVLASVHGQPGLLEGLTAWLLDGHLVPVQDGNALLPGTLLPESANELWRHLMASLPSQGADTLVPDVIAGLALARVPLSPRVVEALAADDPDLPVARALSAAERARLVVGRPHGGWHFQSPELCAWLMQGFAERATRWHGVWLRTLERLEGRAYGRFGLERAWHAEALGQSETALQALLDAATWALGPGEQSWERGLKAADRARTLADFARDPVRSGRAERLRAEILRQAGRRGEAREILDALEPRLMIPPARTERAWCVVTRALLDLDDDHLDAAGQGFEEAFALFGQETDALGRLWVQVGQGYIASRLGHHRLARTFGRDAEEGFKAQGDTRGRLAARLLRATAAEAAGDFETAEQRLVGVMEVADQRGWLLDGVRMRLRRASLALQQARPHDALVLLEEARSRASVLGQSALLGWVEAVRPAALAAAGEGAAARAALEGARVPWVLLREAVVAIEAALRLPTTALDRGVLARLEALRDRLIEACGGTFAD